MLKNRNLILTTYLFFSGLIGIFSLLFVQFNLDAIPPEVREMILSKFSEVQLRFLSLINPTILLIISLLIGFFIHKDNPQASYVSSYISKTNNKNIYHYLIIGFIYGIIISVIITLLYLPIKNYPEIKAIESKMPELPLVTKLLYGGITEEIIVRWGWLSLILFILIKILKKQKLSKIIAVVLSSFLFGLGHLPIVFQNMGDSINYIVIVYVIVFNSLLGIIFGYLFVKYNIETSIFSHIFFHISTYLLSMFFL